MIRRHFLIIGSQGNGTSMLRGLLNAHPKLEVGNEWQGRRRDARDYFQWENWIDASNETARKNLIWGNKLVFQPILSYSRGRSIAREIIAHIPYFQIIWIFRRPGQLKPIGPKEYAQLLPLGKKKGMNRHPRSYQDQERALSEYWLVKDAYPHRVIMVSFEDVIFRPESELRRICDFLGIEYEEEMFEGLNDTGNPCWDYGRILLEKL